MAGGWEAKQQLQGSYQGDLLGLVAHLGRWGLIRVCMCVDMCECL